ncbi:MAG: hypothetical protein DA330_06825 [Nitrososphaera sp.]|nr:hypothetical protein [Nitrososphaera sp.]
MRETFFLQSGQDSVPLAVLKELQHQPHLSQSTKSMLIKAVLEIGLGILYGTMRVSGDSLTTLMVF